MNNSSKYYRRPYCAMRAASNDLHVEERMGSGEKEVLTDVGLRTIPIK
jgi:hypothetical protein